MEIAQGIHRVESGLGVRFMAQNILRGTARTLLVDTGMPFTPAETLSPYLESVGLALESIDEVLISHADLDHSGGTGRSGLDRRTLRVPRARQTLDRVERRDGGGELLWHEPYGFERPDEAGLAELKAMCGGDAPIDEGLPAERRSGCKTAGGSRCSISRATRAVTSACGIPAAGRDRHRRSAGAGIYSNDGELLIPPRIYDLPPTGRRSGGYEPSSRTCYSQRTTRHGWRCRP